VSTGRLITFEGIDGAGKSTHIERLCNTLKDRGLAVLSTREPGGTDAAEALRATMLSTPMTPLAELLTAFAARSDHLDRVIRPALASGTWVVCDRLTDSTYAYQGGGRAMPWEWIATLENWVHQGLQPDLTYWFDLPPAMAASRRAAARSADRFEAEDLDFFEKVSAAYARRMAENPVRFARISAELATEEVWQEVRMFLNKIL
jgi:dTMP kinase